MVRYQLSLHRAGAVGAGSLSPRLAQSRSMNFLRPSCLGVADAAGADGAGDFPGARQDARCKIDAWRCCRACCLSMSDVLRRWPQPARTGCRSTSRALVLDLDEAAARRAARRPTRRWRMRRRGRRSCWPVISARSAIISRCLRALPVAGAACRSGARARAAGRCAAERCRKTRAVAGSDRWPQYLANRSATALEADRKAVQARARIASGSAPSCSLLHVPVDLEAETRLDAELKSWLAFATQKLDEIAALTKALAALMPKPRKPLADARAAHGLAPRLACASRCGRQAARRRRDAGAWRSAKALPGAHRSAANRA